ncbi:hypothetical protein J2Z32_003758 [Paenibacillus turicensis]|uniref:Uncharacterized protein n=1 Tax=Paenibacillus turicensis TaxID=160487 RepID=A0ABS4FXM5_9BACL|nr:hypothetical protein [Paenibacillus turicensis]MBP1907093.1 hypothetical protein [Paenibacillus turicensis]
MQILIKEIALDQGTIYCDGATFSSVVHGVKIECVIQGRTTHAEFKMNIRTDRVIKSNGIPDYESTVRRELKQILSALEDGANSE